MQGILAPYQWLCNGEQLEVVSTFKYLGLTFHAEHDLQPTFLALKQKMFASWALLKRQYGRLQCLSSVGLMFRLCTSVVQSTACYGCEVWGAATFASKEREDLVKGYLQILREITGVRTSTPTAILLAELGLQALSDEWLLVELLSSGIILQLYLQKMFTGAWHWTPASLL